MQRGQREVSFGGMLIAMILLINAIVLSQALTSGSHWYRWLFLTIPILVFVLVDVRRRARN
jgi:hypothetical protein